MSNQSQHTPGPWKVTRSDDGEDGLWIEGPNSNQNVICDLVQRDCEQEYDAEDHANAKLIAAAPDLLTAAKAAKKYLEPDLIEPGRTVFWSLVRAIARAEGK